ncbi:MAG: hypothetical protein ACRDF0_09530 [Candidatus Limnocylindria bacterium]
MGYVTSVFTRDDRRNEGTRARVRDAAIERARTDELLLHPR